MKTNKKGQLKDIVLLVNQQEASLTTHIKFNDGVVAIDVPTVNPANYITNLIETYDLGFANADTKFVYIDYDLMISFSCSIWFEEENVLEILLEAVNEKAKQIVKDICKNIKPNCNIINLGFTFDDSMNSLCINSDIPVNLKEKLDVCEVDTIIKEFWNRLTDESKVAYKQGVVVSCNNDWSNENWNGPQSYGGITMLHHDMIRMKCECDYDFCVSSLDDPVYESYWDEDTVINLESCKEYGINILCNLKNIKRFEAVAESSLRIGICSDIKALINNTQYVTHSEYYEKHLTYPRTVSVSTIFEYDEKYNGFIQQMSNEILSKVDCSKINEEVLPF